MLFPYSPYLDEEIISDEEAEARRGMSAGEFRVHRSFAFSRKISFSLKAKQFRFSEAVQLELRLLEFIQSRKICTSREIYNAFGAFSDRRLRFRLAALAKAGKISIIRKFPLVVGV